MPAFSYAVKGEIENHIRIMYARLRAVSFKSLTNDDFLRLFVPAVDRELYGTMIGKVQRQQQIIDDAIFLQQHCPRCGTYQNRGPERKQHQHDQPSGYRPRHIRQQPGQREAEHQRRQRNDGGDQEGARENAAIDRFV